MASKPKHFTVRNQYDSQILENGVYGNSKVLKRFGTSVDHSHQEASDREPVTGFIPVEITIFDQVQKFERFQ
jgi:hypothetical protein